MTAAIARSVCDLSPRHRLSCCGLRSRIGLISRPRSQTPAPQRSHDSHRCRLRFLGRCTRAGTPPRNIFHTRMLSYVRPDNRSDLLNQSGLMLLAQIISPASWIARLGRSIKFNEGRKEETPDPPPNTVHRASRASSLTALMSIFLRKSDLDGICRRQFEAL